MKSDTLKGIIYSIISAVIYGIVPLMTKEITSAQNATLSGSMAYRFLCSTVFVLVFVLWKKYPLRVTGTQFRDLLIFGAGTTVFTSTILVVSYRYISLGLATACHFFYPIAVCIIMRILFREKFHRLTYYAIFCTMAALAILIYSYGTGSLTGMILAVLSGVGWGTYLIAFEKASYKVLEQPVAIFYIMCMTLVCYVVYAVSMRTMYVPQTREIFYMVTSSLGLVTAMVLTAKGVSLIGSPSVAFISLFEPVTCVITDILFYRAIPQDIQWIGYVLMLLSIVLVTIADTSKNKAQES